MKQALLAALLTIALPACDSATSPSRNTHLGETVELRAGQTATFTDELLAVTFERVSADSRCPLGVLCIRAGEAVVELQVRRLPSTSTHMTLKTDPLADAIGRFEAYEVELEELLPHPIAGEAIPARDYRARLTVTRP